jgi:seryl-tRNA(Sec) selenium transferase
MFFVNKNDQGGQISRQDFLRIGKAHKVPTFNDAAADVPPASRLSSIVKEGFDLVAFSGGKGLCGPQSSGLLLGRKDLTDAGRMCISPQGGIGRGMKVNKEELLSMMVTVEVYIKKRPCRRVEGVGETDQDHRRQYRLHSGHQGRKSST